MDIKERKQAAADYERLRRARKRLNEHLMDLISREEVMQAGELLGFMGEGGQLVFDTEDDTSLLFDFAIHRSMRDGGTAPQRLHAQRAPGLKADERRLLAGMLEATFGLYVVDEPIAGLGARVRDGGTDREYLVADFGLAETAYENATFLGRLLNVGDFHVTSGAVVPVNQEGLEAIQRVLDAQRRRARRGSEHTLSAAQIEAAMISTAAAVRARIEFGLPPLQAPKRPLVTKKPSRNGPCPCGSGRKYKACCGKRPSPTRSASRGRRRR